MTGKRIRPTRRGFLALAVSGSLAGCNDLGSDLLGTEEPPTIAGSDLVDALSADRPELPETVPVEIEASALDERRETAQQFLSSVPYPFDQEEIPNGAMRQEITSIYEQATGALEEAANAGSPFEAMESLRNAREDARAVAAAWTVVEEDLTKDDVQNSARAVRDSVDAFGEEWQYVGDDPVRAVLVHETIERRVQSATGWTERVLAPEREVRENPVDVGTLAGTVERSRASVDDARYLYDRFTASIAESDGLRSAFETARTSLAETIEERRNELPSGEPNNPSSFVDRDIGETPIGAALGELAFHLNIDHPREDDRSDTELASSLVAAHSELVNVRAFDSLRQRVANDEFVTVTEGVDVRTLRTTAIEAIEESASKDANRELNREMLTRASDIVAYADDELGRYDADDTISVDWIDRYLGMCVEAAAIARATPQTSAEVARTIRESV